MDTEIKIEDNIPIPKYHAKNEMKLKVLTAMQPGQSALFPLNGEYEFLTYLQSSLRKICNSIPERQYIIRRMVVDDAVRVWRVE